MNIPTKNERKWRRRTKFYKRLWMHASAEKKAIQRRRSKKKQTAKLKVSLYVALFAKLQTGYTKWMSWTYKKKTQSERMMMMMANGVPHRLNYSNFLLIRFLYFRWCRRFNRFCMLHHLVLFVTVPSKLDFQKCAIEQDNNKMLEDAQRTYQFYKVNPQCNIVEIVALLCANATKDNTFETKKSWIANGRDGEGKTAKSPETARKNCATENCWVGIFRCIIPFV